MSDRFPYLYLWSSTALAIVVALIAWKRTSGQIILRAVLAGVAGALLGLTQTTMFLVENGFAVTGSFYAIVGAVIGLVIGVAVRLARG